jgi:hypothetical protein
VTASLALPRRFAPVLVAAALCGCSMSTEYFVSQSLRHAGFTRAATKCVVNGVAGQLADDQLETLRQPLIRYVMLDQPPRPMQISELLAPRRCRCRGRLLIGFPISSAPRLSDG